MHPAAEIKPQASPPSGEQEQPGCAILNKAVNRLLGPGGTRALWILIYAALFSNACFFMDWTSGVVSYLFSIAILLTVILAVKETGELLASTLGLRLGFHYLTSLALVAGSVMLSFTLIEAGLQLSRGLHKRDGETGALNALAIPANWEKRAVQVEGAASAYYWHGHLHVHNRDSMRFRGDFPPKRPGIFRIIALGDSLTYGYGIDERDTYPKVLDTLLNDTFRVEVLNLGVSGAQSEDIYKILQRKVPDLQPDLVIYGMCLNDFLPSGVGQYDNNRAYQLPLPFKEHFIQNTLTGKLFAQRYDALLMRWGLRVDFFTDILRDFDGYQTRFARDVKAMNAFVLQNGLPPIVSMVLDQYPSTKERRYKIVMAAEKHLQDAGIRLVPSDYIRVNDGRLDWKVSPWEGHPNEKANRVFAQDFAKVLRSLPELQSYRRAAGDRAGPAHADTRPERGPQTPRPSGQPVPRRG